jgi:tetratricopeptide (TPR) repeat protein
MEEGELPELLESLEDLVAPAEEEELNRRELQRQLKEAERRWRPDGDSEELWEEVHDLLINLQKAGDVHSLMKRARRAKRALSGKGSALDLAQASLALWVLERYSEAVPVLERAVSRLPTNRYPWSLMIRHLSWDRDPADAIAYIEGSLDRVPWKAHALVQLGTLRVDAAARCMTSRDLEDCEEQLAGARRALKAVDSSDGCTEGMSATADRLLNLVETMERRVKAAMSSGLEPGQLTIAEEKVTKMEREIVEVAEASGVLLEGEPDDELDLDELERAARLEMPEEDGEETYSMLEVTPKERHLIKKRREE